MPGDWTKKYSIGDEVELKKDWLNNVTDAAIANLRNRGLGGAGTIGAALAKSQRQGLIYIRNDSGADRGRFDVLGISGVVVAPAANVAEFLGNSILSGVVPTTASHVGKFVILQEPIAVGCFGLACVFGLSIAATDALVTPGTAMDIKDGDATQLTTASSGLVTALYGGDDDDGNHWALVRFGGAGGGGGEGLGQYQFQARQNVSDNQMGSDFIRGHAMT